MATRLRLLVIAFRRLSNIAYAESGTTLRVTPRCGFWSMSVCGSTQQRTKVR
jgi:hypothetical protein